MPISPQRFIELKNKIKNECLRRKYVGSVESYGASKYDFSEIPSSNKLILKEHYDNNFIPLNAINNNHTPYNNNKMAITEDDIYEAEAYVVAYSNTSIGEKKYSDCAASCTGLCYGQCSNGCSGCTGCTGCSGGCTGCTGCTTTCGNACVTGCWGCGVACSRDCDNCTAACTNNCQGTCSGSRCNSCANGC